MQPAAAVGRNHRVQPDAAQQRTRPPKQISQPTNHLCVCLSVVSVRASSQTNLKLQFTSLCSTSLIWQRIAMATAATSPACSSLPGTGQLIASRRRRRRYRGHSLLCERGHLSLSLSLPHSTSAGSGHIQHIPVCFIAQRSVGQVRLVCVECISPLAKGISRSLAGSGTKQVETGMDNSMSVCRID